MTSPKDIFKLHPNLNAFKASRLDELIEGTSGPDVFVLEWVDFVGADDDEKTQDLMESVENMLAFAELDETITYKREDYAC